MLTKLGEGCPPFKVKLESASIQRHVSRWVINDAVIDKSLTRGSHIHEHPGVLKLRELSHESVVNGALHVSVTVSNALAFDLEGDLEGREHAAAHEPLLDNTVDFGADKWAGHGDFLSMRVDWDFLIQRGLRWRTRRGSGSGFVAP